MLGLTTKGKHSSPAHWGDSPPTRPATHCSGTRRSPGELRCYPTARCKPNCLHVSSFFPATKAIAGYLIVFNTVGELPTEEQQTSPWTLMAHQADACPVLQTARPTALLTATANTSAPHLQEEGCNRGSVG